MGVSEILKISTDNTVQLLKSELEVQLQDLENQWHSLTLKEFLLKKNL